MFTHAASWASTSAVAIRDASSLEPAVLMTNFSSDILLQSSVSVGSARAKHDTDHADLTDFTDNPNTSVRVIRCVVLSILPEKIRVMRSNHVIRVVFGGESP